MNQIRNAFGAALLTLLSANAAAGEADALLGTWLTSDEEGRRDSVVEIRRDGETYVAEIRWLRYAVYPEGDPMAGQPLVDRDNPDPRLRERPLMGIAVMWGLRYDDGRWVDGHTYAVRKGKIYKSRVSLPEPDTLKMRAYIGTPMLGKNIIWTRSEIPPRDP